MTTDPASLRAENARLRGALENLERHVSLNAMDELIYEGTKCIGWKKTRALMDLTDKARAALAGKDEK